MKLRKRGLIIVAIPLIFLLGLSWTFTTEFLNVLHEEGNQSSSRDFISECYALESKIVESFCDLRMNADSSGMIDESASRRDLIDINKKIKAIIERSKDDPSKTSLVGKLNKVFLEVNSFFEWFLTEQRKGEANWKQVNNDFPARLISVSDRFLQVFSALVQTEELKFSPENTLAQWNGIKTILHLFMAASVFIAIVLGIWYTLTIKRPLSHISETCRRIACNEPLLTPLKSSDELGELDRLFHRLGLTVTKALSDEKAMIENARDLICTLNSHGRFQKANSYARELLGIPPEELIGMSLMDICGDKDAVRADDELRTSCATAEMRTFDLSLVRKDGQPVDTRWSCVWSERDESLFAVVHDITEEKNIERLKQDFVDMISHDLRSPLTSMLGSLSMIAAGARGPLPDAAGKEVDSAVRNVERLVDFINDLLDFQKLKSGRMELELVSVTLREIIDKALSMVQGSIENKNLQIVLPERGATIFGDTNKLTQVVVNLISNAIRFAPPGSSIKIEMEHLANSQVELRIIDSGPGVPEVYREQIFDAFSQIPSQNSKEGTGLGLAISKLIIDAHHGEIGVRGISIEDLKNQPGTHRKVDENTESGSIFWIRLHVR